ncbi:hypothetical protein QR680_015442 [Steinernema hermaphroditum]|uniref:Uncharacterized protein n=1 Tax=Steinernema hermaphroditum TaxID=289476 RepID=A0AA39LK80_9BILA|nr:hypothetical protein QR680_015442 [Steinernema hermaphroditum]
MPEPYDSLYNRILDATALIHMPVKVFTMVIVFRHTPPNMRYSSLFLINGLIWNFAANIIFTFVHVYPQFPAECFRIEGILGSVNNELLAHVLFLLILACVINCILALTMTFAYRYFLFLYSSYMKPRNSFIIGGVIHATAIVVTVIIYFYWMIMVDKYPDDELPEFPRSVFCFKPYGWEKTLAVFAFLAAVGLAVFAALLFTFLLLRNIANEEGKMHKKKLDNHRRILITLISITTIPFVFAALPLVIIVATIYEPHLPFAKEIFVICIVILANHGTLYAIALIIALKPYRQAIKSVILKMFGVKPINSSVVSKAFFTTRITMG